MVGSGMDNNKFKTETADMQGKGSFRNFLEGMVTVAVVLVLVQTFAEDALVLAGASWAVRRILLISGFAFDVFFTLEFLIRLWDALTRRSLGRYLGREKGWIDFAASVPLLIFTSGPAFLACLAGTSFASAAGLLGVLKVVKVIRMARVLRLLRLLKVVKRIRFAESAMVQRHSVRVITIAAAALIFTATGAGMVFSLWDIRSGEFLLDEGRVSAVPFLEEHPEQASDWAASFPGVLILKENGRVKYARYDEADLRNYFGPGDYALVTSGSIAVWFDLRPSAVEQSMLNIVVFLSALFMVAALLVVFSPHFAVTVGDPVNIMLRGMREKSYNLEVRIPPELADDDMFRLASAYNNEFLPLKARGASDASESSLDISLDDLGDLLEPSAGGKAGSNNA